MEAAEPDAAPGPDPGANAAPPPDAEAAARRVRSRAVLAAAGLSVLLVVAVVLGSRGPRDFGS